MALNYSQKRLLGAAMHGTKNKKLQLYAFFTGLLSTLISLAQLIVTALK
jgi:hypothetical protein